MEKLLAPPGRTLVETRWSRSLLLCSTILKIMLSDVLILVMWPKWVHKYLQEVGPKWMHKHLQEVAKDLFSWEKPFLIFYQKIIYTDFEDEVNHVTGTEIFEKWKLIHDSGHSELFLEKAVLKIFGKHPGAYLHRSVTFVNYKLRDSKFTKNCTPSWMFFWNVSKVLWSVL